MTIESRTLKALEWITILEHLSKHATCEIGKERCFNAQVYDDVDRIKTELKFTSEAKLLLDTNIHPPLGGIRNILEFVELAKRGQVLCNFELIDIAFTIGASRRLKSFFSRYTEETPLLYQISINLFENKALEEEILDIFDEAGNILDNASPELKRLRASLKDQTINLKNKLNSFIHSSSMSKFLQEPVYTLRNARYVVPVKVEFKSNVKGIVHDVSSSGATLFIEPASIVELNNSLRELELAIDYEIKRILADLSLKIGNNAYEIINSIDILAEIDFVFAKAKYSISLKAIEPAINTAKFISIKNAKHPILMTVIDKVIPNNIELGKFEKVLVITGSNTGGKTVVLKTTGLCVLMTKAGLHIPADEANIYPFKDIFADIGDEQSVIQNLSTFSGHMTNIINVLNNVKDTSLVLFDEIGAGTDPSEGSSLAQAILEDLCQKDIRVIATTHYGELKALAYTKEGFQNASVEFDVETLAPTYKLLIGIPGKSNAITISANLGLNENIIDKAKNIYLTQKDPTGEIMEGLQNTQQALSRNAKKVEETKEELEKLEKDYTEKIDRINSEKKKTIDIYKKKFEKELSQAKAEIKDLLDEVRRTKSEKIARRGLNKIGQIDAKIREFSHGELDEIEPEYIAIDWSIKNIGDTVLIKDLKQVATLLSLPDKNKNVQVQIGLLKTTVKADKIAHTEQKEKQLTPKLKGGKFMPIKKQVSNTLDLRGVTVDDGLDKVDIYLDEASLANLTPVYIIHGHGTGALRAAIRDYLKDSPYVSKFRPGEQAEGGDGVTVVDLV